MVHCYWQLGFLFRGNARKVRGPSENPIPLFVLSLSSGKGGLWSGIEPRVVGKLFQGKGIPLGSVVTTGEIQLCSSVQEDSL